MEIEFQYPAIIVRGDQPYLVFMDGCTAKAKSFLSAIGVGGLWEQMEVLSEEIIAVPVVHADIVAASRAGKGKSPRKSAACARNARLGGRHRRRLPTEEAAFELARSRNQPINAIIDQTGIRMRFWPSGKSVILEEKPSGENKNKSV